MKGNRDRERIRLAYKGVLLFGVVSLFGDIIYEGARGVAPTYLDFLGASALVVGFAFGLGEFLGYGLRLLSGLLADTTRAYWLFFFLGYILLLSIPLIGFTSAWELVVALILVERVAKALRSPARDTLLSVISREVGAGKAFGLHELLDQVGAVLGPGIVAFMLFTTSNNYFYTFTSLFLPYLLLLAAIFTVYSKLKRYTIVAGGTDAKPVEKLGQGKGLSIEFKVYTLAVALNTMGLIHISLILYRASETMIPWIVSALYLLVQAVDAASALFSGYMYDKYGRKVLLTPFILSVFPSVMAVLGGQPFILTAALTFGFIYGMQESIYRAAVSDLTPVRWRGTAYGIFNAIYGLGFLLSGSIYGYFIKNNLVALSVVFAVSMQAIASTLLIKSISQE